MADNAIFGMAFCHFTISFTINLEGQRNSSVSLVAIRAHSVSCSTRSSFNCPLCVAFVSLLNAQRLHRVCNIAELFAVRNGARATEIHRHCIGRWCVLRLRRHFRRVSRIRCVLLATGMTSAHLNSHCENKWKTHENP